jgi:hypothetical protein
MNDVHHEEPTSRHAAAAARGAPAYCQLKELTHATAPLALDDQLRRILLRLESALRRRLARVAAHLRSAPAAGPAGLEVLDVRDFAEGERVRVLPLERLRPLLDAEGRTNGLTFLDGMERFCGRELTVKRKVHAIFDEKRGRMVRLRRTYLLEGAVCDSRGLYDREGCDRCCYYFWRDAWLEPAP